MSFGPESDLYSFPGGHPMNYTRTLQFKESLNSLGMAVGDSVSIERPVQAHREDLFIFHEQTYVDAVVAASEDRGTRFLDFPDTPSFPGIYEAALYPVGSTLHGLTSIMKGRTDHYFNPIGGLHHAFPDRAAGFCVFNDASIAILAALRSYGISKVAYVDIDAHHGDGVYYGLIDEPRVVVADIHEDGRSLFPGTGDVTETGTGPGRGTKLNIPLVAGSGDREFFDAFDAAYEFVSGSRPELIFLQCGADGLEGDPLTHLRYSPACHKYATRRLHQLAHETCGGRILAMGGGGYDAANVDAAWSAVARELSGTG